MLCVGIHRRIGYKYELYLLVKLEYAFPRATWERGKAFFAFNLAISCFHFSIALSNICIFFLISFISLSNVSLLFVNVSLLFVNASNFSFNSSFNSLFFVIFSLIFLICSSSVTIAISKALLFLFKANHILSVNSFNSLIFS
jgi:hypothetical protein